jgi:tRNA nucleotidyltransferase (CCA-adding enzyme)
MSRVLQRFDQIVTTHRNTDFDALASVIAATILYKDAVPVLPSNVNPNVRAFLSLHKDLFDIYHPNQIDFAAVNRLIVVDVNRWSRLEGMHTLRSREDLDIIIWDHHDTVGDIHAAQVYYEPVGATITLMIEDLKHKRILLTPILATLFLTGIYEDTGHLTFPSTKAADARAVVYLLDNKADLNVLSSFLRPAYGEKHQSVLFEMLKSAENTVVNGYRLSFNRIEINGHVDGLALVVRMYHELLNVDAAFGLFTDREHQKCMVIGRSNNDGLNMGTIMRSIGGGGHPGAGSALLKDVNPRAVQETIQGLIAGNQQASVQVRDLMSFPVFTLEATTRMKAARNILEEQGYTGVPVIENEKLVGIISKRDFRKVRNRSGMQAPVKAFMSRDVKTIEPHKSPTQAARLMAKYDIGRLPVVAEGKIIGIVTRRDVMLYFYDLLPD